MLKRFENWPIRLDAAIAERADREFQYGTHDCGLAVAELVEAMTGVNFGADLPYSTKQQLLRRVITEKGGGTLDGFAEYIAELYGLTEVGVNFAQRGDVVLCDTELGATFGLVDLSGHQILCAAARGFVRYPIKLGRRAWRIG